MGFLDGLTQLADDIHTIAGGLNNTPPTPSSPVPGSSAGSNIFHGGINQHEI